MAAADAVHKSLAEALVAAQAEMPAVAKDKVNPHFKSRFTSLDNLIATTRPVLVKHGLAITQAPTQRDGQPALATTLWHVSGETETTVMLLIGATDMQKLGAAITYAKRYAWGAVCAVSTEEDDDGNRASQSETPAAQTNGASNGGGKASEAQVKNIFRLIHKIDADPSHDVTEAMVLDTIKAEFKIEHVPELSKGQASGLIERLMAKAGEKKREEVPA